MAAARVSYHLRARERKRRKAVLEIDGVVTGKAGTKAPRMGGWFFGHFMKDVLWEPGVEHRWEAFEDCIVLSVRCPSVPDDQIAGPAS